MRVKKKYIRPLLLGSSGDACCIRMQREGEGDRRAGKFICGFDDRDTDSFRKGDIYIIRWEHIDYIAGFQLEKYGGQRGKADFCIGRKKVRLL